MRVSKLPMVMNTPELQGDTDSWLDALRARGIEHARTRAPRLPRGQIVALIFVAILLHVLLAFWLSGLMREAGSESDSAIQVTLIDAPPSLPALPVPPARELSALRQRASVAQTIRSTPPKASSSITAPQFNPAPTAPVESTPAPPLHLYKSDGSLDVPDNLAKQLDAAQPRPDFIAKSVAPSPLMLPHRPVKVRPNYFAGTWAAPQHETLLNSTARKVSDFIDKNLTAKKEFRTPWDTTIKCGAAFMFIIAGAGCGWGYPPEIGTPSEHWKPATQLDEQ